MLEGKNIIIISVKEGETLLKLIDEALDCIKTHNSLLLTTEETKTLQELRGAVKYNDRK